MIRRICSRLLSMAKPPPDMGDLFAAIGKNLEKQQTSLKVCLEKCGEV